MKRPASADHVVIFWEAVIRTNARSEVGRGAQKHSMYGTRTPSHGIFDDQTDCRAKQAALAAHQSIVRILLQKSQIEKASKVCEK